MRPEEINVVTYVITDGGVVKIRKVKVKYIEHSTFTGDTYYVIDDMLSLENPKYLECGNNLIIPYNEPITPDSCRMGWVAKYEPLEEVIGLGGERVEHIFVIGYFR